MPTPPLDARIHRGLNHFLTQSDGPEQAGVATELVANLCLYRAEAVQSLSRDAMKLVEALATKGPVIAQDVFVDTARKAGFGFERASALRGELIREDRLQSVQGDVHMGPVVHVIDPILRLAVTAPSGADLNGDRIAECVLTDTEHWNPPR